MRELISLNSDWLFFKGDIERAHCFDLDESAFEKVSVPHCPTLYTEQSCKAYAGVCVYRRRLRVKSGAARYVIRFDGVFQRCKVYFNERLVAQSVNGSLPFSFDISGLINFSGDNLLCVVSDSRADENLTPGKKNPDFQYFGGIHRNVCLLTTDDVYITETSEQKDFKSGVYISSPLVTRQKARLKVFVHVKNASNEARSVRVSAAAVSGGRTVCSESLTARLKKGKSAVYTLPLEIDAPLLWSPSSPRLYEIKISLEADGGRSDEVSKKFGIRKIEWSHEGLYLNGRRITAQGINLHSEFFALGSAVADNAVFEEIKRVKRQGFDFIRMSHYPHSAAYYDACDELGVLVLDCMSGWQYFKNSRRFKKSCYDELYAMLTENRSHACIAAVETSLNESEYTRRFAYKLNSLAHRTVRRDGDSRIYTAGWKTNCFDLTLGASQHDIRSRADKSRKGVIISEYGDWDYGGRDSTSRVRLGSEAGELVQAQNHIESQILSRSKPWFSVDGLWSYSDYSGYEKGLTYSGVVDLYRRRKISSYFFESQNPFGGDMIHIANRLSDDSIKDVTVFSSCDSVELFVNGKSFAKQQPDAEVYGPLSGKMLKTHVLAHPPFTFKNAAAKADSLLAVGFKGEREVCRHQVLRAGQAVRLSLEAECGEPLRADGSSARLVFITCLDENGSEAGGRFEIEVKCENGRAMCAESLELDGGMSIWVRSLAPNPDGFVRLDVKSDKLKSAEIKIPTAP